MHSSFSRPLTSSEIRRINARIARIAKEIAPFRLAKDVLQVLLMSSVAGVFYKLFTNTSWSVALIWTVGFGSIMSVIIGVSTWRKAKNYIQILSAALKRNTANVVRISSQAYASFQEYEDLGVLYAFQIEPDKLFILRGQEYYETGSFPCLEFELVDVPDAFNIVLSLSQKTLPMYIYPESDMLELAHIADGDIVEGEVGIAFNSLRRTLA
jgi:hypothetical protein